MIQNMRQDVVDSVLKVALDGESVRGDNGAVLIDEDTSQIVYLLSHEFQPREFSTKLNELLSDDERKHIFIVHKSKDAMHISKIPRGV